MKTLPLEDQRYLEAAQGWFLRRNQENRIAAREWIFMFLNDAMVREG
jgi:hypothetical protein